jgi:hypothetical protein
MPSWKKVIVSGSDAVLNSLNVTLNVTASSFTGSFTGSLFGTASFAQTASYANNFTVAGTLTAQTIVVQTITSSVSYLTGSTRHGSLLTDTHQFTGSVGITGSLTVTAGVINQLTSSYAVTSSYGLSAISSSYASSSQIANTASYVLTAQTASYVNPLRQNVQLTGSLFISSSTIALNIFGSGSGVFSVDGTSGRLFSVDDSMSGSLFSVNTAAGLPIIEAFSDNTIRMGQFGQRGLFVSGSRVGIGKEIPLNAALDISGSAAITGSFSVTGSSNTVGISLITGSLGVTGSSVFSGSVTSTLGFTGSLFGTASYASQSLSSSFASTASYILNAQTASYVLNAVSSSYATQALTASNATTASHALTVSGGTTSYVPLWTANTTLGSSVIYQSGSNIGIGISPQLGFKLDVNGWVVFRNTNLYLDGTIISFGTNGNYQITDSGDAWLVGAVGNLGIGKKTIPNSKLDVNGNAIVTGSLNVTLGITGSLSGSATNAQTASYADNFTVGNTLTAQRIVVQTISSSISYLTGSTRHGSLLTDTHQFTGSVGITGSLNVIGSATATTLTDGYITINAANINRSGYSVEIQGQSGGNVRFFGNGSNPIVFNSSTGNTILGSNTDSGFRLDVSGSTRLNGAVTVASASIQSQNTSSLASGTQTISTNATSSFTAAFYNYTIASGSNTRAGQFIVTWNGSSIQYMDNSTVDIGNTSTVALTASLSGANVLLTSTLPSSGWTIKTLVNLI